MNDNDEPIGFLNLSVYMTLDLIEVVRVMQTLVRQKLDAKQLNVYMSPRSMAHVRGLEKLEEPVMVLKVTALVWDATTVERTSKALNRLVSVFKVTSSTSWERIDDGVPARVR